MKDSQSKKQKIVKAQNDNPSGNPLTNTTRSEIWFVLPVVSLFIVLLVMVVYDLALKQQINENKVLPTTKHAPVSVYPFLKTDLAPNITAQSAIILDANSKTVLYEKNAALRFSMASTTKIMTALVGLEYFKPNDTLTIARGNVEGVNVGFVPGEKVLFENVLYAMLLPSGNDAAYAIADNYPGGITAFVQRMNQKAKEMHLPYTNYADPAGLDDDGNFMTVYDLARLTTVALENEIFATVVSTKYRTFTTLDGTHNFALTNLNKLLGENGITGVKTGTTQGAGEVLVTSKKMDNHTFIFVVMKSKDRFADTRRLMELLDNNVSYFDPTEGLRGMSK